jgi:hypothetical protein
MPSDIARIVSIVGFHPRSAKNATPKPRTNMASAPSERLNHVKSLACCCRASVAVRALRAADRTAESSSRIATVASAVVLRYVFAISRAARANALTLSSISSADRAKVAPERGIVVATNCCRRLSLILAEITPD